MIKAGNYFARAIEARFSENQDKRFVEAIFEITTGEQKGQRLRWKGWLTEKTRDKTIEQLMNAGYRGGALSALAGLGEREVQLKVEHERGQRDPSKVFARVRWVNPIPGFDHLRPTDPHAIDALGADYFARTGVVGDDVSDDDAPPPELGGPGADDRGSRDGVPRPGERDARA